MARTHLTMRMGLGPTITTERYDRAQELSLDIDLARALTRAELDRLAHVVDQVRQWADAVWQASTTDQDGDSA